VIKKGWFISKVVAVETAMVTLPVGRWERPVEWCKQLARGRRLGLTMEVTWPPPELDGDAHARAGGGGV